MEYNLNKTENNTSVTNTMVTNTADGSEPQDHIQARPTQLHDERPNLLAPTTDGERTASGNLVPKKRTNSKFAATSFVDTNRHGVHGDSSEEEDENIKMMTAEMTPMTKKRVAKDENLKKIDKLGPWATAFTIFKGFVCTGILYMPKDFINGGYLFSAICIICALFLTLYCAKLLMEVADKTEKNDFPSIGFACYGKWGKIAVDIVLFASQFGFVTAYVYFIAQ